MTIRYVYIDDETEQAARPLVDVVVRANDELRVDLRRPDEFSKDLRLATADHPDGMILDLRLDRIANQSGKTADYRAPSLAQEIRTRAAEGVLNDIPIVLWSTQVNLSTSYEADRTGHDLFDLTYVKDSVTQQPQRVARELIALAEGYKAIRTALEGRKEGGVMRGLLGLDAEIPLDARVDQRFSATDKTPIHEWARFILQDVIGRPGVLLDEERVAALLGVSIPESRDWPRLRDDVLRSCAYRGLFSSARPRWWKSALDRWWASLKSNGGALRLLGARKRVEVILQSTGFRNIVAAPPILKGYSERYSTICEATRKPLDPVDGFQLREDEPEPWQERKYVSGHAALERIGYDQGIRLHPLERERYDELVARAQGGAKG